MIKLFLPLFFLFSVKAQVLNNYQVLDWNGIEVHWLEDDKFPLYQVVIYFSKGSSSDNPQTYGETKASLELMNTGTNSYTKGQILSSLEFYGTQTQSFVTHEYSTYSYSGLVKDIVPTTKMICHLFNNAAYPKEQVVFYRKKQKEYLSNLVNNHAELADLALRKISLQKTPFAASSEGEIKTIGRINSENLKNKLDELSQRTKKIIYIRGPGESLNIKKAFANDCEWSGTENNTEKKVKKGENNPGLFFVVIPKSTQTQIRVGSYLEPIFKERDELSLLVASYYLGGGFTSRLIDELRTKQGYIYSLDAMSVMQRDYGRSFIRTSTSHQNVQNVIDSMKKTIKEATDPSTVLKKLEQTKKFMNGHYYLALDDKDELLQKIILLEHKGHSIENFKKLPAQLRLIEAKAVAQGVQKSFNWEEQTVVILGPIDQYQKLKKVFKKLEKIDYKELL